MDRLVSYEGLPVKSGGAHGLGQKTSREAYHEMKEFLGLFPDDTKPHSVSLTLYRSDTFDFRKVKLCLNEPRFKF